MFVYTSPILFSGHLVNSAEKKTIVNVHDNETQEEGGRWGRWKVGKVEGGGGGRWGRWKVGEVEGGEGGRW